MKFTVMNKLLLAVSACTFSQIAWSHPGHNHADANASMIHLLWLAPIVLAAGIAYYRVNQKRKAAAAKQQEQL